MKGFVILSYFAFQSLMDEEIHTFSCTLKENKPLIDALYVLFESKTSVEASLIANNYEVRI